MLFDSLQRLMIRNEVGVDWKLTKGEQNDETQ